MDREILDRLEESANAVKTIWSTLEAVTVAMSAENAVCETYIDAVRGAADNAYRTKNALMQMLIDFSE